MRAAPTLKADVDPGRFQAAIAEAPLAVFDAAAKAYVTIPTSLDPLVVDDAVWRSVARDAPLVLGAMEKTWAWLRRDAQRHRAALVFGHLRGVEHDAAQGKLPAVTGLATARFDLFFDGEDLKILEVNATIPAMQAYSDMARTALAAGLPPAMARTLDDQSNVRDLLGSLLRQYDLSGGRKEKPRIAVVAREGDSQLAELRWLERAWGAAGHEVLLTTPQDVVLHGDELRVGGVPIDVVYRHVFAYRLTPGSDFERACRESRRYRVFNPVAAHLEVKGLLAETSRIADSGELGRAAGLSDPEVEAVRRRVPWTRLVLAEDSADLRTVLERSRESLVVKTSSGYGGHGVVMGATFDEEATQRRVAAKVGDKNGASWGAFCTYAASGAAGLWVAQERIPGRRVDHRHLARDGAVVASTSYVDCSLFGGLFEPAHVPGGASRFSADPIVNIGRGGGLVPLLMGSEAARLGMQVAKAHE